MIYKFIKRPFDIIISVFALPFFLIILIVVSIAIKIDDRGPVFYKAPRIGKDSKKFYMIKFRSMKVNAPDIRNKDGSTYNSENDPRVTKVGKILRESSLDETAQLLNIIRGDMSIIGPRASVWDALDTYKEDEVDKMKVRPGITGYSQAYFRNNISVREKRLNDAWYANNISLWLDIKIFFKTIQTVLKHESLYTNNTPAEPLEEKDEEKEVINK